MRAKKIILILKRDKGDFYIECKDFGIGIESDVLKKIGTCTVSTKCKNRGFGLYALKHLLVHILDGKLYIQSEPNNGSLFSCRLPIRK